MQKGIVMEIQNNKATVLKNNGDFVSVSARPGWQKGDVVTIKATLPMIHPLATIAACFLLFFSASAFGLGLYYDETTLVSLDINPSIELSVNRFDRVIDVRSLNDDGADILKQINVKNQTLDNAVSALFDGGLGDILAQNPFITITVFSSDTQNEQLMLNKLQTTAQNCISPHHADAKIELLSVDETLVTKAHQHHMTAGKYTALCELQEVLPEMEIDNYSHHSISYIKEQTKLHGANHDMPPSHHGKHNGMGKHQGVK